MSVDNSTGITLPYEKQAQRGDEMPTGLDYPDQLLYQALALLYARHRMNSITRDQAIFEKKKLLKNYRIYKFQWDMGDEWTRIIKSTELARAEYRKNRTLENADMLLKSIEGAAI